MEELPSAFELPLGLLLPPVLPRPVLPPVPRPTLRTGAGHVVPELALIWLLLLVLLEPGRPARMPPRTACDGRSTADLRAGRR